jgi:hypothetical protein
VRRIVATLLVVASPLLMAVPVSASGQAPPAVPAVLPAPATPAVVQAPAAPVTVAPPAVPAATAVQVPARPAPSAVHRAVITVRAKAPEAAGLSDAAYAARLQAELCRARQIFCGLDRGGRYLVH